MRKVTAICVYHGTQAYSFTVSTANGDIISMFRYNEGDYPAPYNYPTFNDMYKSLLQILKNNNMYTSHYTAFGREWYNIVFIDLHNPTHHENFGYKAN